MKRTRHLGLLVLFVVYLTSCTVPEKKETSDASDFTEFEESGSAGTDSSGDLDSEFEALNEGEEQASNDEPSSGSSQTDEFADFDEPSGEAPAETNSESQEQASGEPAPSEEENPVSPEEQNQVATMEEPAPEATPEATPEVTPEASNEASLELEPEPPMPELEEEKPKIAASTRPGKGLPDPVISGIQYRANESGGTLIIEANTPLTFQSRLNPDTRQFVVIVKDVELPTRLQRPFDTRDFTGPIGSVDAYQRRGSGEARIVVQLREGAPEPVVQAEGNTLFVVAMSGSTLAGAEGEEGSGASTAQAEDTSDLFARDRRFNGKKISIETDGAEVKDVLKLLSEEANVNLVVSDEVSGKISLKLKAVPWDQALVMIMKSKKLGYSRSGNVLRIAPMREIREEEEAELKDLAAKAEVAPLTMKTLSINYAKVEDLARQAEAAKSTKGKVVSDPRTSTLILHDTPEFVSRMESLVRSLDVPPHQVLIEGKVVEASETFQQNIGVRWGLTASGTGGNTQQLQASSGNNERGFFNLDFTLGITEGISQIESALQLFESMGQVKVISSPRVMTLHNEPAEISQSTQIAVPTVTPVGNTNQTTFTFREVLLKLNVTPQVTNDGAIILTVDVTRQVPGAPTNGQIPIDSRAAKTKVIVKNNQTAVVGGIYQNDNTDRQDGVPVLSKIPVVGWLFKSKKINQARNELLIFITPRLMNQMRTAEAKSDEEEF